MTTNQATLDRLMAAANDAGRAASDAAFEARRAEEDAHAAAADPEAPTAVKERYAAHATAKRNAARVATAFARDAERAAYHYLDVCLADETAH